MESSRVSNDKVTFSTSDLICAAYLRTKGVPLIDVKRNGGTRSEFVFTDDNGQGCEKLVMEFMNDGLIPCRSFANTIRDMKGLVKV